MIVFSIFVTITAELKTYTNADGLNMTVDVTGPERAPVVILLHGGGQTRHAWNTAMLRLKYEGYRIINLDCRGHGDSDWTDDGNYSVNARSADLQTVIHQIDKPYVIVGASMGAMTALYNACTNDEHIHSRLLRGIVLVDMVPAANPKGIARIRHFMQKHLNGFSSAQEAISAIQSYNPRNTPPNEQGVMKNLRLKPDGRLYWHWDPALLDISSEREGKKILQILPASAAARLLPILLVRGLQSDVVEKESVRAFAKQVDLLEQVDVSDAGHMVAGDRNDAFNEAVIQFLHKHLTLSTHSL